MQISKNKVVSLTYLLRHGNASGEIIEQTTENEPLIFIYGQGQMLPRFEEHLHQLTAGDNFEFALSSEDAYGDPDPDAIIELEKGIFVIDGKLDEEMLRLGNFIPMRDQDGNMLQGKVVGVTAESVRMDFNHPMAGIPLHFTGKVTDVREATDQELNHGHVHSEGCSHC
jgi:FKBP-type peptidyl-prolyl cis-trans isomerase SlyD